ncbi:activating signal cointegrator 1 complex subunit 3, partial [Tachysurus ichikawai]
MTCLLSALAQCSCLNKDFYCQSVTEEKSATPQIRSETHPMLEIGSRLKVESTQSMIRILGLSATLPNYLDVASFLHVNPYIGLFYFDGRFRPVPLGQTFVGIKTTNKIQQLHDMEEVCYDKVLKQIKAGYQ